MTGRMTFEIAPEKKQTSRTAIQILDHFGETVGLAPGIMQGQILLPSRGGTGSRFTTASMALTTKILIKTYVISSGG